MPKERTCGCKGIRTCLLCETENNVSVTPFQTDEAKCCYTYCPHCNLCWSDDKDAAPLYLGRLKLLLDFLSEEEENYAISAIDNIPWMPSQSGRKKQDFGPKVNFKKKKVKIGEFRGFPKFTDYIIQRLQKVSGLSDFRPVELCNLEYSPERGSSIDPHVDDFWLWGERLVTINLSSPTVLTLVPCSDGPCDCHQELNDFSQTHANGDWCYDEVSPCDHNFRIVSSTESFVNSLSVTDNDTCDDDIIIDNTHSLQNSERNTSQNDLSKWILHDCQSMKANRAQGTGLQSDSSTCDSIGFPNESEREIKTMCSLFRTANNKSKGAVRIVLPPRSLFVLAGCLRYNWSHEIKRQDVMSRRLAMTFRELTAEFLDGGKESQLGKELLLIANNFIKL